MARECILVIERDPEHIEFLLTNVLSPQGYLAQTATCGRAGLRAAQEERPDLVLLDLGLKDMGSAELLQQLQACGDPPVILMTPPGTEAQALHTFRWGVCDALIKPFTAQEMIQTIARVLRRERLAGERDWLVRKLAAANEELEHALAKAQALRDRLNQVHLSAELSAAQYKSALILRTIAEGVYTVNQDLCITSVNPAVERITGWRESELLGRRYVEVFAPEDDGHRLPPDQTLPGRALQSAPLDNGMVSTTSTILRKDGRRIPVVGTAALLREADTSVIGVLATMRDLTPEPDMLATQSVHLGQLTEKELDILHLEQSTAPTNCHPVTLKPIIDQVVQYFQETTPDRSFWVHVAPDLPFVLGDENKTELALVNLIDHALALGDPQQSIMVSANAGDDCVVVTVQGQSTAAPDAGCASDPMQAQASARKQATLYIARKLIRAQGGQVWIESQPKTGNRFHFSLPPMEVRDEEQAFIDR